MCLCRPKRERETRITQTNILLHLKLQQPSICLGYYLVESLERTRNSGAYAKQTVTSEVIPGRAETFERRVKTLITAVMQISATVWPLVCLTIVHITHTIVAYFTRAPLTTPARGKMCERANSHIFHNAQMHLNKREE